MPGWSMAECPLPAAGRGPVRAGRLCSLALSAKELVSAGADVWPCQSHSVFSVILVPGSLP